MPNIDLRRFVVAASAIIILGYFWQSGRIEATPPEPQLQIVFASQPAEGAVGGGITPQFVSAIEKYSAYRLSSAIEEMARQTGNQHRAPTVNSTSRIVEADGKKLAIISHEIGSMTRSVEIISISGQNLDRVSCSRDSLKEISLVDGPCAQAIKSKHGVSIGW